MTEHFTRNTISAPESEESADGQVTLTLSQEEFAALLMELRYAMSGNVPRSNGWRRIEKLLDRLNRETS